MAHIFPVFKKGSKSKVENYYSISLTSITFKLVEHTVHSSEMDHHEYLNCFQRGFKQNHNCESQLITTVRDLAKSLNEQGQMDSKAFDKVNHR